jgi:catechol 2,3-dioxygenase
MATDPLDWDGVLSAAQPEPVPAGMDVATVMGHVHLHVADLAQAEQFYGEVLGFDRVLRYGRAASFYSVGGYHHHLGLNTWVGEGAPPAPEGAAGMTHFTILLPSSQALGELADWIDEKDVVHQVEPGALMVEDPSGNRVRVALQQNNQAPKEEE